MTDKVHILWADDEIDLLKPHVMFLKEKGYLITTVVSGDEAIDLIEEQDFDIVFLDEQMPGLSGLETLERIKRKSPSLPVVMITKSEEEFIMNQAIGSKISDYLIKPVNPNQIILTIKKNLDHSRLISEKTSSDYQQQFRQLGMMIDERPGYAEWIEIYKTIVYWELELEKSDDNGMKEVLAIQKNEANQQFSKFIQKNYEEWLSATKKPIMSHTLLKEKLLPLLQKKTGKPTFFILIDNLRFDQWKTIKPTIEKSFKVTDESVYYSILPTSTQYARNALFAGLMPSEIEKKYPKWWVDELEEEHKNQYEAELLGEQLKRYGVHLKTSYNKILNLNAGKRLVETIDNLIGNPLNVIVYNFVDMLSHSRTEMEVIKELADDESAYRSLTNSWFQHSPLHDIMKQLALHDVNIVITTDHGSIRVQNPIKVIGDKNTSTNLRYKQGKNLDYNEKDVFAIKNPQTAFLPKNQLSTSYIFAMENKFFAYPNNFNYYVNYYRNTFQHGGVSLEEVLIPYIEITNK